jgi:hypothetical protein
VDEISNYTALIAALENPLDEERRKIAFYLIDKMDKDIIKKELIKKKKSALDYAKEWGESEIVEKIKERLSKI